MGRVGHPHQVELREGHAEEEPPDEEADEARVHDPEEARVVPAAGVHEEREAVDDPRQPDRVVPHRRLEPARGEGGGDRERRRARRAEPRLDHAPEHPDPVDVEHEVQRPAVGQDAGDQAPGLGERRAGEEHEVLDAAAAGLGQDRGHGPDDHDGGDGEALGVLDDAQGGL